jgi:predicted RNA-binding Zn ribbon-like protein
MSQKKSPKRRPPQFDLIGGSVPLDFINTYDDRFSDQPKELLKSYRDLARFAEDTHILDPAEADHLVQSSQHSPQEADRILRAAIELREASFAVIWAMVTKKPVPRPALRTLNRYVQQAAQHSSLVEVNGKFAWRFEETRNHLESPLWPIARAAADLLASDHLEFVRACASETCQWLFLDVSKNHRRRWCDMTRCGNREKVRNFYARQKKNM